MEKRDLIERCREHNVRFVRLQFTELYGQLKNVSIPVEELEKALDNELMFDGSSIRGYKRIEQSDMYFHPDPDTFQLLPWRERESGAVARLICDVADPDGTPVRRRPARGAEARRAGGQGPRLHDERGARGGVLPLQARGRRHAARRPARPRRLLRRRPVGPRREHPPRHRGHARPDGLRPRGVAPRGRDRPARDRLPPRGGADLRRQPDHVPLGRAGHRAAARHARDVHAEADLRRERLGHAHEPVADGGERRQRLLRPERRAAAVRDGVRLHRRPAGARQGHHGGRQPDGQLVQAARAGLRGAGLHRVVAGQPLRRHPRAEQARPLHARRAAHAGPDGEPVPGVRGRCWRPAWTA